MPHRVKLKIHPGGKIESVVEGISGPACEEKTAWLNRLGRVVKDEPTAEMYESSCEVETNADAGYGGYGGNYGE
jgi:hypothetical protein